MEAVKALPVPGHAKTSLPGRKTVLGPSCGSAGEEEGEGARGSENETHLVAARPPWAGARQSAAATQAARHGGRASLKAADGDHLAPRPDSDVEGAGAAAQDRIGAVVECLKGWNQAAPTDLDEGTESSSLGRSVLEVPRQRRGRNLQGLGKFVDNGVN